MKHETDDLRLAMITAMDLSYDDGNVTNIITTITRIMVTAKGCFLTVVLKRSGLTCTEDFLPYQLHSG